MVTRELDAASCKVEQTIINTLTVTPEAKERCVWVLKIQKERNN
jgi:hypothetical protein